MAENSGPTSILAAYAAETTYRDFPDEVIHMAKRCIVDSIGCAYGGAETRTGRFITGLAEELGGPPEALILWNGNRVSAVLAASTNSKLANVLDFDDTLYGHPGACVVHPALALAQKLGSSGKELIRAVILGYEVSCRIAAAIQPSHERFQRIWGLAPWNTFGAAVACGALLGLDPEAMARSMGIAGANAPVSSTMKTVLSPAGVTMTKESFMAAAAVGYVSAILAQKGYVGPSDILDGDTGFWIMYGSDRCDFERMVRGLGSEYEILKTSFKPYPACRWMHASIDAMVQTVRKESLDPDSIEEIAVYTFSSLVAPPFTRNAPTTMEDAQFSLPFSLAMGVYGGEPGPDWYKEERFNDPRLQRLSKLVRIEADEEADRVFPELWISKVFIRDSRGRSFITHVDFAKGSPQNPMTDEELARKFIRMASGPLGVEKAKDLYDSLMQLERLSISDLRSLLA